jgi:Tol biopolymer transport system component
LKSPTPYELLTSPDYVWSAAENLGPVVNSAANERGACLAKDGLSLLFASDLAGDNRGFDLYLSKRANLDAPWEKPQRMPNSPRDDAGPSLSADGLSLYYYRDDRPPSGKADLFMMTRPKLNEAWTETVSLGPEVNSTNYDYSPEISADGLELYFHSGRDGGGVKNPDLFVSRRKNLAESFGPAENVGAAVNSAEIEYDPCLSSDGRVLIFLSARPGNPAKSVLWMSTRGDAKSSWSQPVQLDIPSDNAGAFGPALSADGGTLVFHRTAKTDGLGGDDLWQVRRVPKPATKTGQ